MNDFFKNPNNTKWLGWSALAIVPILSFAVMFNGFVGIGLQIFATYMSIFVGIIAGGVLGKIAMKLFRMENSSLESRLCSGLSCFGFIFLPNFIFSWSGAYLGMSVDKGAPEQAFWGACIGGVLFFALGSSKSSE